MMRLGVNAYNRHARIYRRNRVVKIVHVVGQNTRYSTGENERCNNCKATFWQYWHSDEFPHYCPKCRFAIRKMFNGKFWDDEEEIPF